MLILKNKDFTKSDVDMQPEDLAVHISSGLDKSALLKELKGKLKFPDYFGENWDALADVMRDLRWLPKKVVVIHEGPPKLSGEDYKIYLDILNEAVSTVHDRDKRELVIAFPEENEELLSSLLRQ